MVSTCGEIDFVSWLKISLLKSDASNNEMQRSRILNNAGRIGKINYIYWKAQALTEIVNLKQSAY